MKAENAIEVRNITKNFKVYLDKGITLKEKLIFKKRNDHEIRKVLNGISFEVKKGEAIGLIGHNGCGKSTTLKLLTKIMYPDSGTITMRGRVSSLIELGAGFHPDMSGRENIYINASIFGLTKKEIDARLSDIIAFSELEEFIDNPVRTYSSGMYMRLAFSVAINVDADILLIDEILAVGDMNFQAKCFDRLKQIKSQGTTIVIVSHSLGQIEEICERSIWIDKGLVACEGKPEYVHGEYTRIMNALRLEQMGQAGEAVSPEEPPVEEAVPEEAPPEEPAAEEKIPKPKLTRWGNGDFHIKRVRLLDENDAEKDTFYTGESFKIVMDYEVRNFVEKIRCGIGIFRQDGLYCYGTNTAIDQTPNVRLSPDGGQIVFASQGVQLIRGEYIVDVSIQTVDGTDCDFYKEAAVFSVFSPIKDEGILRIDHQWHFRHSTSS